MKENSAQMNKKRPWNITKTKVVGYYHGKHRNSSYKIRFVDNSGRRYCGNSEIYRSTW